AIAALGQDMRLVIPVGLVVIDDKDLEIAARHHAVVLMLRLSMARRIADTSRSADRSDLATICVARPSRRRSSDPSRIDVRTIAGTGRISPICARRSRNSKPSMP